MPHVHAQCSETARVSPAGAGQGIGRAFAHALGEAGAAVAVADINGEAAERVAAELAAKGVRATAITADVTQAKECQRCWPERTPSNIISDTQLLKNTCSMPHH